MTTIAVDRDEPKPQEIWRHFRGAEVRILLVGDLIDGKFHDTAEIVRKPATVIYESLSADYTQYYSRNLKKFMEYVSDSRKVYRFEKLNNAPRIIERVITENGILL